MQQCRTINTVAYGPTVRRRRGSMPPAAYTSATSRSACSGESPAIICMRGGRSAKMICVVTNQVIYSRPTAVSIMDT